MLSVEDLVKSFEGTRSRRGGADASTARVRAVEGVSFDVTEGELFTLLGPSGCGKTTTLRSIAGLETPDSGEISVGDRVLFSSRRNGRDVNIPANGRGLGMVFQSYAIWPHLTVFDNAAFPLQIKRSGRRPSKREISERVMRVLDKMGLVQLADRPATRLSGGQQQRLALARAIVTEPPLLLLDEPLSNLDAKLRESLRYELKRLQRELNVTSVYVTHDQIEALALSTKVAVMREGSIVQLGRPREVYDNPANKFVAEFIGTSNFIGGRVTVRDGHCYTVEAKEGRLIMEAAADIPVGTDAVVSLRPECVEITTTRRSGEPNEWTGTVLTRAFLGDAMDHVVGVGEYEIRVRCNPSVSIGPGTQVYLYMRPDKLTLVPT